MYEAQFEGNSIQKIINYFPAAFVSLAKLNVGEGYENGVLITLSLTWDIYLAARNLQSKKTNITGLNDMIIDTINGLQSYIPIATKSAPLLFQDGEMIVNLPGIIIYRVTFQHHTRL